MPLVAPNGGARRGQPCPGSATGSDHLFVTALVASGVRRAGSDPVTSELFDQQHLVGVLSAQPIRTVNEYDLDVARGCQVAHPFQSRPFERRPAIAVVLEDPVPRHFEIERRRPLDERRRLACDRVFASRCRSEETRV